MVSKVLVVAVCLMVAVGAAYPGAPGYAGWGGGGAVNPWIPSWIANAPWYPQWTPCVTIGSSCIDCSTRLVCTKVGGLQRTCNDPAKPHCNLGECSETPSDECAPNVPVSSANV